MLRNKSTIYLYLGVSLLVISFVQTVFAERSQLYKDKNSYFAVKVPDGWKQEDYPSETVRSKVAFHHPTINGVLIRIISGPTPTQGYTLDDLYQENKAKIENYFKAKFPNGHYGIRKSEIDGRQVIIQRNSRMTDKFYESL